ncbi:MAG: methyltransferase domain-containing protein [Oscillospiraceae bacterium]
MTRHPMGEAMTMRLVGLAALSPCRVLDLGAGDGDAVRLLRGLGFDALGLDRLPGADVLAGDLLAAPFPDASFDALLSECAFFVCGDARAAMAEAARLLKSGGRLLLSDVCFGEAPAPAPGLRLIAAEDATDAWRQYYIECIWNGEAPALCAEIPKGACKYYLTVFEKE